VHSLSTAQALALGSHVSAVTAVHNTKKVEEESKKTSSSKDGRVVKEEGRGGDSSGGCDKLVVVLAHAGSGAIVLSNQLTQRLASSLTSAYAVQSVCIDLSALIYRTTSNRAAEVLSHSSPVVANQNEELDAISTDIKAYIRCVISQAKKSTMQNNNNNNEETSPVVYVVTLTLCVKYQLKVSDLILAIIEASCTNSIELCAIMSVINESICITENNRCFICIYPLLCLNILLFIVFFK
jgi:hypothetical protein